MARVYHDLLQNQTKLKLNISSPNLTHEQAKSAVMRNLSRQQSRGEMKGNQHPILTNEEYKHFLDQRQKLNERAFKLSNLVNQGTKHAQKPNLDKRRPETAQNNAMGIRKASQPALNIHKGNVTTRDVSSRLQNQLLFKPQEFAKPPLSQKISSKIPVIVAPQSANLEKMQISTASMQQNGIENYIIGKNIGQGAYAQVKLAVQKQTGKSVAIKIYEKYKLIDPNRKKSVLREIKVMQKFNHINIVKLYEAIDTSKQLFLVMEFVSGISLHAHLKKQPNRRLDENEAKRIIKGVLSGIQYCHSKSVAHRDIKLENILLDEERKVKIIDFGFSTCMPNDKKMKMFCGTPSYMAPEIVSKREYAGPPVDI